MQPACAKHCFLREKVMAGEQYDHLITAAPFSYRNCCENHLKVRKCSIGVSILGQAMSDKKGPFTELEAF